MIYDLGTNVSMRDLAARAIEVGEGYNLQRELNRLLPGGHTAPLMIEVDTSAVQDAVDEALKEFGVLGEIAYTVVLPDSRNSLLERIEQAHRTAHHAQFTRKESPGYYRNVLLQIAALSVDAIKEFDNEQC